MELRHALPSRGSVPERAKALRQTLIKKIEDDETAAAQANGALLQLQQEMEDVFFVMQLYSYPGDYLHAESSVERIAETVDKFEEDILGLDLPSVRGRRRVVVRFGHPLEASAGDGKKVSSAEMTTLLHGKVQELIHGINADHGKAENVPLR
jgi:hypothetical protein